MNVISILVVTLVCHFRSVLRERTVLGMTMRLLYFFSKAESDFKPKLLDDIRKYYPFINVKVFTDYSQFCRWLQIPPRDFFAAILQPHNQDALIDLLEILPFLADRKVMLSVPESSNQCLMIAHKLNPNYLFSTSDKHIGAIPVLKKWLEIEKKEEGWVEQYSSYLGWQQCFLRNLDIRLRQ
jgi:hypothetical protein